MKRAALLIAFIAMAFAVKAQDIIVLRNTSEIQAKIEAVRQNEIIYRKWTNLEGPTYTLAKGEIFFIRYANGEKEIFSEYIATKHIYATKESFKEDFSNAKFQGYTYLGADFNAAVGGPSLDFSFGARTSKYIYLGAGVGWHNLIGESWYYNGYSSYHLFVWLPYLTFTSDIKCYIPTSVKGLYPRFDLSFGGCIDLYDALGGFYMSFGAGFDYRKFSFGIGYQMPIIDSYIIPLGYVRLGIRLGK